VCVPWQDSARRVDLVIVFCCNCCSQLARLYNVKYNNKTKAKDIDNANKTVYYRMQ